MDEFGTQLHEAYKAKFVTAILSEFTNLRGQDVPAGGDDDEIAPPDAETVPGKVPTPAVHAPIAGK